MSPCLDESAVPAQDWQDLTDEGVSLQERRLCLALC